MSFGSKTSGDLFDTTNGQTSYRKDLDVTSRDHSLSSLGGDPGPYLLPAHKLLGFRRNRN